MERGRSVLIIRFGRMGSVCLLSSNANQSAKSTISQYNHCTAKNKATNPPSKSVTQTEELAAEVASNNDYDDCNQLKNVHVSGLAFVSGSITNNLPVFINLILLMAP